MNIFFNIFFKNVEREDQMDEKAAPSYTPPTKQQRLGGGHAGGGGAGRQEMTS